jgi:hypothetical protein
VKTYFLEPGIVSKANRRRLNGSVVLSRGFIVAIDLKGKKDEKPDIVRLSSVFGMSESVVVRIKDELALFGASRRVSKWLRLELGLNQRFTWLYFSLGTS